MYLAFIRIEVVIDQIDQLLSHQYHIKTHSPSICVGVRSQSESPALAVIIGLFSWSVMGNLLALTGTLSKAVVCHSIVQFSPKILTMGDHVKKLSVGNKPNDCFFKIPQFLTAERCSLFQCVWYKLLLCLVALMLHHY